jgi:hypothetical protein
MHLFIKFSLIFSLTLLGGCFQTKLNAPPGHEVRLLSLDEPTKFRAEYKNWYLFYGLIPIWTTQPEEIIKKQNLVEARAQTQDTVSDAIITTLSSFLPILVFTQHVIVEGNRKSDLQVPSLPANNGVLPDEPKPGDHSIPDPQTE